MPRHLEKRRRRWYAVLDIPEYARHAFEGKKRLLKTLKTESLSVAERRVGLLISGWKSEFEAVRGGPLAEDDVSWYREHLPLMSPAVPLPSL